ncbi:MAG: 4Fe-4S dicluster domain-containing protein [Candidatus Rokubacteria bacterium]|nr:4Fe-4S dicluster domain-containing protein [Candidatus Rokubacteria bacterium]
MRWGVVLCSCNETLRIDPKRVGAYLGLTTPPVLFARLPRDEVHSLVELVNRERFDRVVIGCCGPADLFREAVGAAGGEPTQVVVVNLKEQCFWAHPPGEEAEAKAARLLRASMRLAETSRPAPEVPVKVGGTVLIATDSPAGLHLARRLGEVGRPVLVLDERSEAFDGEFIHPLPWKTNWGRVTRVEGSLGAFRVTVERSQPLDLETCVYCRRCVPVCHTSAISEGLRLRLPLCDRCGDCLTACEHVGAIKIPRQETETIRADQVVVITADGAPEVSPRTGYHLLRSPSPGDMDGLAWKVFGLIGEFRKPEYVTYHTDTCAGGSADHESCGICIGVCPYHAIARDPTNRLRVRVDQQACEGCGACVSACPTSSLTFNDPPPADLYARMAALLAPLPGHPQVDPPVVAFHCPEKGQVALAEAGRLRLSYPPTVLPVPMACLRHVSEANILAAFRMGAAGVALVGCESCPHGERQLLLQKVALARSVLDAFGVGGERVHVITGEAGEARTMLEALERFVASLGPAPVRWDGRSASALPSENREVVADAVRALIDATGREPGRVGVGETEPFAFPDVRAAGCTMCRTCVNVCPTHAFKFEEARQTLELKQIACVNCGLCATACPEHVITLKPEVYLDRGALDWQVVVRDETVGCLKCGKPFINRRALEAVEAKVLSLASIVDTFAGTRRDLLRMCPNCRAVAAVFEMDKGWEP